MVPGDDFAMSHLARSELMRWSATCRVACATWATERSACRAFVEKPRFSPKGVAPFISRQLAAAAILMAWRRLRLQTWMNEVVRDAVRFHAFAHRMSINFVPLRAHFRQGIVSLPRLMAKRSFVRLDDMPRCANCAAGFTTVAGYVSIGSKMVRSTPHLTFGCLSCVSKSLASNEDYYQRPLIALYDGSGCSSSAASVRWKGYCGGSDDYERRSDEYDW